MCVYSTIIDHHIDKWSHKLGEFTVPSVTTTQPDKRYLAIPPVPAITAEEIAEFRKLLERAREYDKRHNEPDCELDSKKQTLLKLAKLLGVTIDFL